jgi:hypothetical protein
VGIDAKDDPSMEFWIVSGIGIGHEGKNRACYRKMVMIFQVTTALVMSSKKTEIMS